jgi:hypothetical protein
METIMSDSIEELERQFAAAEEAKKRAEEDYRTTRRRLQEARAEARLVHLEEQGITPGTKITDGRQTFGFMGVEPDEVYTTLARAVLVLHKVKADGTIGDQRVRPTNFDSKNLRVVP